MSDIKSLKQLIAQGCALPDGLAGCRAYPESLHEHGGALLFMARSDAERFLVVTGEPAGFEGEPLSLSGLPARKCPLTPGNAARLMELFPFAAPTSRQGAAFTMGLGDRLGLASPGHIRAVRGRGIFPVLAQQSMRELKLTGRTYEEVLAAAAFAVFQEDWQGGWGADGDHLKTADEIRYALRCGYTMITLDCSEQIGKGTQGMDGSAVSSAYGALPLAVRSHYEEKYSGKVFRLGDAEITITAGALKEIVLTYAKAVDHTLDIYCNVIEQNQKPVDFEMSIDETLTSTAPEAHFVVAKELTDGGVRVSSLAPRFCGEFQKGIDYIGDVTQFEEEFVLHEKIAEHFGYRLSIHSGSDKFAVFGAIGRHTGLHVHVKTAGTNWLEALRVIARENAPLFRELLAFALERLQEARAYYHISAQPANVEPPEGVPDERLSEYLDRPDSRQILHITYGLMLQEKDADGSSRFKDRIFAALHRCEQGYAEALEKHIGRHVDMLASNLHSQL